MQDLQRLAVEKYLEHANLVGGNLATGQVAEEGTADLVRNPLFGQLTLRTTEAADLRQGVNAGRDIPDQALIARVFGDMGPCETALVVGGTGKVWETDDVAHRIDMRLGTLVSFIDSDITSIVLLNPQHFNT